MEKTRDWSRESIEYEISSQFSKIALKFGSALLITFLTVMVLMRDDYSLFKLIYSNQLLIVAFPIIQIAIVLTMSLSVYKMNSSTLTILFIIYSILTGLNITPYIWMYNKSEAIVLKALFTTIFMFGTMAFYGFITRNKVYKLDKILSVALIALLIMSFGLFFFRSSVYEIMLSVFGAILFLIYTVYDVQVIKKTTIMMIRNTNLSGANQIMDNIATISALKLYLDFINLFIYIIRIFAGRSRD